MKSKIPYLLCISITFIWQTVLNQLNQFMASLAFFEYSGLSQNTLTVLFFAGSIFFYLILIKLLSSMTLNRCAIGVAYFITLTVILRLTDVMIFSEQLSVFTISSFHHVREYTLEYDDLVDTYIIVYSSLIMIIPSLLLSFLCHRFTKT